MRSSAFSGVAADRSRDRGNDITWPAATPAAGPCRIDRADRDAVVRTGRRRQHRIERLQVNADRRGTREGLLAARSAAASSGVRRNDGAAASRAHDGADERSVECRTPVRRRRPAPAGRARAAACPSVGWRLRRPVLRRDGRMATSPATASLTSRYCAPDVGSRFERAPAVVRRRHPTTVSPLTSSRRRTSRRRASARPQCERAAGRHDHREIGPEAQRECVLGGRLATSWRSTSSSEKLRTTSAAGARATTSERRAARVSAARVTDAPRSSNAARAASCCSGCTGSASGCCVGKAEPREHQQHRQREHDGDHEQARLAWPSPRVEDAGARCMTWFSG